LRCVHFHGGGVRPPTQNGWAVPPPEDRHTLLPKIKGRREGVEDATEEGTCDGVSEHEVTLTIRLGSTVDVESPSRVGLEWEGRTLSGGRARKGSGINQCNNKVGYVGVLSEVGG
jgi:hypothetical protein